MARRRQTNRGSAGSRRRLFWARSEGFQNYTSANAASIINLLADFETAYGADLFGFTVTRIVGSFTFDTSESSATAGINNQRLQVGIRVEDEQAIANTNTDAEQITMLPREDKFSDWMYSSIQHGLTHLSGDPIDSQVYSTNRWFVDLRAQRRLDELGQSLYLFTGDSNITSTLQVPFAYDLNILCKRL